MLVDWHIHGMSQKRPWAYRKKRKDNLATIMLWL